MRFIRGYETISGMLKHPKITVVQLNCKKCITKGPMDTLLEGCPWDAIDMLPLEAYEKEYGTLPY